MLVFRGSYLGFGVFVNTDSEDMFSEVLQIGEMHASGSVEALDAHPHAPQPSKIPVSQVAIELSKCHTRPDDIIPATQDVVEASGRNLTYARETMSLRNATTLCWCLHVCRLPNFASCVLRSRNC